MPMLVFDLGDVIIRGINGTERALSHDLQLPEITIRQQFREPELRELFVGQITERYYWETLIARHRWNTTAEILEQRVRENMVEVEGMFDIIDQLHQRGTELALLSNQAPTWADFVEQRYPQLLIYFPHRWYSHQLRLAKPDPRIFQHAIDQSGRRPSELLFIDDHQPNLLGAAKVGVRTLPFHTPHQLQQALRVQGYL